MAMGARKYTVTVTSIADGSATAYTPYTSGYVESVQYVKTDYTDGVDFALTSDQTGENVWTQADVNAAAIMRPRAATHTTAGVAALYAATGAVNERTALARERIKIVLAQAGATKTGAFVITIADK